MKVWIAVVPTRYEIVGVGNTAKQAVKVACEKALEYCGDDWQRGFNVRNAREMQEWFGVTATEVTIGEAEYL